MNVPIPAIAWLRDYDRARLHGDLVAGFTAAAVVVPQAMAYADIAGLPLVVGLYTALVPLVVYAVMGTSRPLSVTTTSTLAILTAGALHAIAPGANDALLVSAATTLAFLAGGILLIASLLRLGVVASFISEPVLVGFKAGVGTVIVVDQIPKLLGVHFDKGHFFHNLVSITDRLPQASVPTILLALAMLALQIGLQRFLPQVPASLVTVAAGIAVSSLAGLNRLGIELVGEVQGGLPSLALPDASLFPHLWPAAIGIALMSFVETAAAGQAFRGADEPRPEANKELLALGLTFGDLMRRLVDEYRPQAVVIDCSAIPDFEYTALKMLTDAERKLQQSGVSLSLASLNPEPLRLIQKSALGKTLGHQRMHFNLEEAVRTFRAQSADSKQGRT